MNITTENFIIEVKKINNRIFYTAFFKPEKLNWLTKNIPDYKIVEVTIDLIQNKEVYLNRIDSYIQGHGYGFEVLQSIIKNLKKEGINKFKTYIEHNNIASKSMIKKLKFKEIEEKQYGSYWINENILSFYDYLKE